MIMSVRPSVRPSVCINIIYTLIDVLSSYFDPTLIMDEKLKYPLSGEVASPFCAFVVCPCLLPTFLRAFCSAFGREPRRSCSFSVTAVAGRYI